MIPKECKRLAEVDFPIAEVSKHATREKSIRRGHPSTLHLWWARRPLASSRAVLMALLLPDPCDEHCPAAFKQEARQILLGMHGRSHGWSNKIKTDIGLRQIILKFIADFANWDNAANSSYLKVSRSLVKAAHPEEPPLVVDPFAGGGSIPLEALRIGCDTFASDLNPVACLILEVMLDDIPRYGPRLADELRRVGTTIKEKMKKELADLYPKDPNGATPIAYLWARTVRCESPNCGAEIPLLRSFWLCKKPKRRWALRYWVEHSQGEPPRVKFEIFEPKSDSEVHGGTVARAKATCLCCETVLPPDRVRSSLSAQRGGADVIFDQNGNRIGGARMTAVVMLKSGEKGRHYRLATKADYAAVHRAQEWMAQILDEWERKGAQGLCPVPDEPLPPIGTLGFRVQRYGMLQWNDLFTSRQKMALMTLGRIIREFPNTHLRNVIAFGASKQSDFNSSLSRWANHMEKSVATFGRHALPILWDWGEVVPIASASGGFDVAIDWVAKATETIATSVKSTGQVQLIDATSHDLPDEAAGIWFTDPPYYDAIPYADLSDYFLVWLKRLMPDHTLLRDPFDSNNPLSPKTREAVYDSTKYENGRVKNRAWFEEKMAQAFAEGRRILNEDGVGSVVFAHKTTEGWEALLSGMIRGGWTITGSWPIATEKPDRMRAMDSAALATSVHLICRPRPYKAAVGDWADVLRDLLKRVSAWMNRLQGEGIRGADLVFACVGPALEIFSRYSRVETAEGNDVELVEYLEKVWEVVGYAALEQVLGTSESQVYNSVTGVLEEDARLTALFLWTLQSTEAIEENGKKDKETVSSVTAKGFMLPFDIVRRFAQPMGIDLDIWTGRIIGQEKGMVRLLPVTDRAKELLGEDGTHATATWFESSPKANIQATLFSELDARPETKQHRREKKTVFDDDAKLQTLEATVLDRVHAAMLMQAGGHANALRTFIHTEQDRGPNFLRLANALSALYPRSSEEKRLLDAMLLTVPQ